MTLRGTLRSLPDRALHGWRRRALLRRLARTAPPRSIMFVCHGNICRSPFAAAIARKLMPDWVRVESAGFIGPQRPAPPAAVAVAREHGVDLAGHRSQLLAREHLESMDMIVVMEPRQERQIARSAPRAAARVVILGDLDSQPIARRVIKDPVDQPDDVFRASYDRIERCIGAMVDALALR